MTTVNRIAAPDYAALAAAFLDSFKSWARVDHNDDDEALELLLAEAMNLLERQLGISIAYQEWTWTPIPEPGTPGTRAGSGTNRLACCGGGPAVSSGYLPIPIRGVQSFTVTRGEPPVDVSDQFYLSGETYWGDFGQTYLASYSGVQASDDIVLVAGTDDAAEVPPALVNILFRYALFLWENRESGAAHAVTEMPDFLQRAWSIYWTPRL